MPEPHQCLATSCLARFLLLQTVEQTHKISPFQPIYTFEWIESIWFNNSLSSSYQVDPRTNSSILAIFFRLALVLYQVKAYLPQPNAK